MIRDLSGPPNFWDEATIRHNVLNKYAVDQVHGTAFDEHSVMLYAFPDDWTANIGATAENPSLSDLDKLFVAGQRMYPGRVGPEPTVQKLEGGPRQGAGDRRGRRGGRLQLHRRPTPAATSSRPPARPTSSWCCSAPTTRT